MEKAIELSYHPRHKRPRSRLSKTAQKQFGFSSWLSSEEFLPHPRHHQPQKPSTEPLELLATPTTTPSPPQFLHPQTPWLSPWSPPKSPQSLPLLPTPPENPFAIVKLIN